MATLKGVHSHKRTVATAPPRAARIPNLNEDVRQACREFDVHILPLRTLRR
jgi:hypothetical protein